MVEEEDDEEEPLPPPKKRKPEPEEPSEDSEDEEDIGFADEEEEAESKSGKENEAGKFFSIPDDAAICDLRSDQQSLLNPCYNRISTNNYVSIGKFIQTFIAPHTILGENIPLTKYYTY